MLARLRAATLVIIYPAWGKLGCSLIVTIPSSSINPTFPCRCHPGRMSLLRSISSTVRRDASIDLTAAVIRCANCPAPDLVDAVRAAVQALPEAGVVSIEEHYGASARLPWLAVCRRGMATVPVGPEWDALRVRIASVVKATFESWSTIVEASVVNYRGKAMVSPPR